MERLIYFQFILLFTFADRTPSPIIEPLPNPKYDNPNFIKDRHKDELYKPHMPDGWVNRFTADYSPMYMDYCAPYHCNAYNKQACGLHRKTMRFKWFRSACHIIWNNKCTSFNGNLKYDIVDIKYCMTYLMFTRSSCPKKCDAEADPICGISTENDPVVFLNRCVFHRENCKVEAGFEYEAVNMTVCNYYIKRGIFKIIHNEEDNSY